MGLVSRGDHAWLWAQINPFLALAHYLFTMAG